MNYHLNGECGLSYRLHSPPSPPPPPPGLFSPHQYLSGDNETFGTSQGQRGINPLSSIHPTCQKCFPNCLLSTVRYSQCFVTAACTGIPIAWHLHGVTGNAELKSLFPLEEVYAGWLEMQNWGLCSHSIKPAPGYWKRRSKVFVPMARNLHGVTGNAELRSVFPLHEICMG